MITGPFITPHAVNQFRERIAGVAMTYEAARSAIIHELHEHGRAPVQLSNGRGLMVRTRGGRYEFRAVICPGDAGPAPAVVTILASGKTAYRNRRARERRRQQSGDGIRR